MLDVKLDDFKPKILDNKERWNDWYLVVNFEHEKTEYLLTWIIAEGTLMGGSAIRLALSSDPFQPKIAGEIKVLESPIKEIMINKTQKQSAFKYIENENSISVEMDDLSVTCNQKEMKFLSKNDNISGELTCYPRGPFFWWGNERNAECNLTERSNLSGVEILSDIKGMIKVDGKEIEVNGSGVFERLWIRALDFLKIRFEDWIYANFDNMYTFLCHVESTSKDGRAGHYETGTLYLINEDDYLFAKEITFIPSNWIFIKDAYRFIPMTQRVKVLTDKGILKLKTTYSLYPQIIGQPMRIENLTMNHITGWNLMFYDIPFTVEGKFTYNNGKKIKLENGRGLNNVVRNFPLY
ncbi:MAG: hypothetical protein EAX96_10850 [Candidatus Lokiarchaeota archaeon]|nr:hypothetical protein [Candidatus Lokiarchaeota archaeon]